MLNLLRGDFEITIQGKAVPVCLNMNAFRLLTQRFKVKLVDLDTFVSDDALEAVPAIAFCGALNAAARKGTTLGTSWEEFAALFFDDESNIEAMTEGLAAAFGNEGKDEPGKE